MVPKYFKVVLSFLCIPLSWWLCEWNTELTPELASETSQELQRQHTNVSQMSV